MPVTVFHYFRFGVARHIFINLYMQIFVGINPYKVIFRTIKDDEVSLKCLIYDMRLILVNTWSDWVKTCIENTRRIK